MSSQMQIFKYKSPIGDIYCLFEDELLVEVSIRRARGYRQEAIELKKTILSSMSHSLSPIAYRLFNKLDAYFDGRLNEFTQKIKFIAGTAFEQKVWLELREIPFGETRSYKWIAEMAGNPNAVRAVGQALKKNPLPIILPCHRVIASDGSIGGFSCGVEIKRLLLKHEGVSI